MKIPLVNGRGRYGLFVLTSCWFYKNSIYGITNHVRRCKLGIAGHINQFDGQINDRNN